MWNAQLVLDILKYIQIYLFWVILDGWARFRWCIRLGKRWNTIALVSEWTRTNIFDYTWVYTSLTERSTLRCCFIDTSIYDSLNVIKAKILNISDLQSLTRHIVSSSVQLRLAGSAVLARLPNHQESHWGCFSQRFSNVVTEQGPLVMTSDPLESGRKFRSSEAAWDPAVCLL